MESKLLSIYVCDECDEEFYTGSLYVIKPHCTNCGKNHTTFSGHYMDEELDRYIKQSDAVKELKEAIDEHYKKLFEEHEKLKKELDDWKDTVYLQEKGIYEKLKDSFRIYGKHAKGCKHPYEDCSCGLINALRGE